MYIHVYKCAKVISKENTWLFSYINKINYFIYLYVYIYCVTNNSSNKISCIYPTKELKYHYPNEITVITRKFLSMGVSVAYLSKACIHNYYHVVSVFEKLKDQICNAQNRRSGEMADSLFEKYKILSCHMESIFFRQNLIWKCQQYVHIHNQNMHYHIGNVFCIVLRNIHGLIFQAHNHISTIHMLAPLYVFMSINTLEVVLCMDDALLMKINSFNCMRLIYIKL